MVEITKHSGIYTLRVMQKLPIGLPEAWDFFSSPHNLSKITPSHMKFEITSPVTEPMYPGQIITYKVAPIPGIKVNWVTEITHVREKTLFVDNQRFGPYAMWHHEHHFKELKDGILMTDKVSYKIPWGLFGRLAHVLFVKKKLNEIFTFRAEALNQIFPPRPSEN